MPLLESDGGMVHQIIGDAVMVIFNQHGDEPEHALRAARTALAFQAAASEIAAGHEDWPRFRAGVNSGEVLAGVVGGESGHRKHGVVGDTVNLAARLEAAAPVGAVVVGAETAAALPPGHGPRTASGTRGEGQGRARRGVHPPLALSLLHWARAPVAQWIEQWFPKPRAQVRFLPGALSTCASICPASAGLEPGQPCLSGQPPVILL